MNLKEYISTGVLELYVMGALSTSEQKEVEQMLRQHPELRSELTRIENAIENMAQAQAVEAPPHLRDKIKSQLEFNAPAQNNPVNARVHVLRNYRLAVAACITLAVVSSTFALYYRHQWQNTSSQLAQLTQQQTLLSSQVQRTSDERRLLQQELAIIKTPEVKVCTLKGIASAPNACVLVYWNQAKNETFVTVKNLPPAPAGSQYQLWAMAGNTPVDAGVFETGTVGDSLQKVKNVLSAQAFAVTLEKKGGSPTPTLEKLIVIGNI